VSDARGARLEPMWAVFIKVFIIIIRAQKVLLVRVKLAWLPFFIAYMMHNTTS
jgi:hypothetical protein